MCLKCVIGFLWAYWRACLFIFGDLLSQNIGECLIQSAIYLEKMDEQPKQMEQMQSSVTYMYIVHLTI